MFFSEEREGKGEGDKGRETRDRRKGEERDKGGKREGVREGVRE